MVIDIINGQSGTAVPIGTLGKPVNNIPDAIEIATVLGLGTIFIVGDITLGEGDNVTGFKLIGQNPVRSYMTVLPEAITDNCEIKEVTLIGTLDGNTTLRDCVIGPLDYVNGSIIHCGLTNMPIVLGGNAQAIFADTYSLVPGFDTPTIDMNGEGQELAIRGHVGGLKIVNRTGTDPVSIDMISGHLKIDSSCIAGKIYARGLYRLTDNSPESCEVLTAGRVQTGDVIDANIVNFDSTSVQQMVTAISEVGYTNDVTNKQIVQLDKNGNEMARFNCFNESGQATLSNIKTMVLAT